MKLSHLSLIATTAFLLTACTAHVDPNASVRGDGYRIDVDGDNHYHGQRKFCPPGHAKKGWC